MKMQHIVRQSTSRWLLWLGILMLAFLHTTIFTANRYNVLGISSDQPSRAAQQKTHATLQTHFTYWQRIVAQHPEHRDGWLALATLAYQLDNTKEALVYLNRVKTIDPNHYLLPAFEEFVTAKKK